MWLTNWLISVLIGKPGLCNDKEVTLQSLSLSKSPSPRETRHNMAESRQDHGVDQSQFCCSVCLDLLKEPVTILCGHNYCRSCIEGCWDLEEEKKQFSCPQCREVFLKRPVLGKNTLLAELVGKLKGSDGQETSPSSAPACAGPDDVACNFCCETGPKKASMSCLTCLASYCPAHLGPHYRVPVLKTHQLVSVTIPLKRKMCKEHNKLMEVYCVTDRRCICYLCTIDYHRQHRTTSATAERQREQEQLISHQKTVQQRIQEREGELKELLQALKDFESCSQNAKHSIDEMIDEMISFIWNKMCSAKTMMTNQEKTAIALAAQLQLQLEEEIATLRKRSIDLEELSHSNDHIHFIQTFQTLSTPCESPDLPPGAVARPRRSVELVTDSVRELKANIEALLNSAWPKISASVSALDVILPPVPKTRDEFLRHCRVLSLDSDSAHRYLSISEEDRRVSSSSTDLYYPTRSDRFTSVRQVLCREGLAERCYWEVAWSCGTWEVAVAYKDISRGSSDSAFGKNDKSWSLQCSPESYTFRHHFDIVSVSGPRTSKIGVYLDYVAGTLSFYSVSDQTMILLHKVETSFTQPVYPGFGMIAAPEYSQCYAELMKLW